MPKLFKREVIIHTRLKASEANDLWQAAEECEMSTSEFIRYSIATMVKMLMEKGGQNGNSKR